MDERVVAQISKVSQRLATRQQVCAADRQELAPKQWLHLAHRWWRFGTADRQVAVI
jgi:hypothetical protein